jgi:hypothetical protein
MASNKGFCEESEKTERGCCKTRRNNSVLVVCVFVFMFFLGFPFVRKIQTITNETKKYKQTSPMRKIQSCFRLH